MDCAVAVWWGVVAAADGGELFACVSERSTRVSVEASHGLIGALLKDSLFNGGQLAAEGGNQGRLDLPPVAH